MSEVFVLCMLWFIYTQNYIIIYTVCLFWQYSIFLHNFIHLEYMSLIGYDDVWFKEHISIAWYGDLLSKKRYLHNFITRHQVYQSAFCRKRQGTFSVINFIKLPPWNMNSPTSFFVCALTLWWVMNVRNLCCYRMRILHLSAYVNMSECSGE